MSSVIYQNSCGELKYGLSLLLEEPEIDEITLFLDRVAKNSHLLILEEFPLRIRGQGT